jgi:hypothetical protein
MQRVLNYFHQKFLDDGRHWYPFLSVFELACNGTFRCPYCGDGFDDRFMLETLRRSRLSNPSRSLTASGDSVTEW